MPTRLGDAHKCTSCLELEIVPGGFWRTDVGDLGSPGSCRDVSKAGLYVGWKFEAGFGEGPACPNRTAASILLPKRQAWAGVAAKYQ